MAYAGSRGPSASNYGDDTHRSELREPGARRRKIAGYLKAANELRQSYFSQEGAGARQIDEDDGVEGPGAFADAAAVRSGNEEMILFPSYAREHTVVKKANLGPAIETTEQDYWQKEWERHQDDNAIVDVDVRGWIYTPHRGQANRKQRLMIGLARQLSGIPAPPSGRAGDSRSGSGSSSRVPSPTRQEEDLISFEAENIVRKGKYEQQAARRGAFSEDPATAVEQYGQLDRSEREPLGYIAERRENDAPSLHRLSYLSVASSTDGESLTPPKRQESWQSSTKISSSELHTANRHLLHRLKPFMATPLANSPISAFFYNESVSRQHTFYTNGAGHFSYRAALDFIPTHVRVLAAEKLSATEEVKVTAPTGVSLISDIDDTVKHSAITSGAREIFRTAFVRELGELLVDGVREWYNTLSDMGVEIHYVSNSPWQMYPVLTTYFKLAGLPKGSFHLKQYSGMLQGIFEPVAERKRMNLEKIMIDFPDRKFILIGDSGEADLEVYTEVALENPGRIAGIFIRDVTTSVGSGYFDSSSNPGTGNAHRRSNSKQRNDGTDLAMSKRTSRQNEMDEDDADLRTGIAASLADMEAETKLARKNINPDLPSAEHESFASARPPLPQRRRDAARQTNSFEVEELLIDFSDETLPPEISLQPPARKDSSNQYQSDLAFLGKKPSPTPPPKPRQLRSPSPNPPQDVKQNDGGGLSKAPPPRPRKPSSAIKPPSEQQVQEWSFSHEVSLPNMQIEHQPSPLRQVTQQSPVESKKGGPPLPPRSSSKSIFANRGKALPPQPILPPRPEMMTNEIRPTMSGGGGRIDSPRLMSIMPTRSSDSLRAAKSIPAPLARQRKGPVLPPGTLAPRQASNMMQGGWGDDNGSHLPGSPSEAGVSKKEFLWMQRWARAKRLLEPNGVTLRSWRVGSDVADVCVKLVEHTMREMEKERRDKEFRKNRS